MSEETNGNQGDEGGMCADVDSFADMPYAVAPTVDRRYNTIRLKFQPAACWRIDDRRFDFDSSFILPTGSREFALLAEKRPPGPPAPPGTGPYIHVVQSGEWLDGIARSYGFQSWRDLYYADENAAYRTSHPDPNKLYPGDELVIPGRMGGETNEPQEDPDGLRLTVFGHADPSGRDDYNHVLAGRRAKAVFGLLIRDVDIWDELYRVSFGGDQWTLRNMQMMLVCCGYAAGEPDGVLGTDTMAATRAFQADQGIATSGYVDVATRKKLFRAYMDAVCVDGSGKPFQYNRKDFLSRGETKDGKAEYQSCSEFNPLLVFSQDEEAEYAKPENKGLRDAENMPNRRVAIYMFPPNPRFPPEKWPCPTIKEGAGKCKAQFWIDGEKRRNPQGERRDSRKRGKTMACKWYDGIVWRGTCEGIGVRGRQHAVRVLGFDLEPVANTTCELSFGATLLKTTTDDAGIARFSVPRTVERCSAKWQLLTGTTERSQDACSEIVLNAAESDTIDNRLANLGHDQGSLSERVRSYQREMDQPDTGDESDIANQVRAWHDGGSKPELDGAGGHELAAKSGPTVAQDGRRRRMVTAGPRARVELFQDSSGFAPGTVVAGASSNLRILSLPRGSHSAVVFHGAGGLDIRPNNQRNAVPGAPSVWVDEGIALTRRTICFYGRRFPLDDPNTDTHVAMFDVCEGGKPTRSVLQVIVDDYPRTYAHVRLYGTSLALNDKAMGTHAYQMGQPTGPGVDDWSHSRRIVDQTAEAIIDEVLRVALQAPGGVLDHLVINAHGTMYPNGAGQIVIGDINDGNFDNGNLSLWDRLNGKVRYVWAMNCLCGNDNDLFGSIAKRIGGKTTAMYGYTALKPNSIPPNHVEYFTSPVPKHWDGHSANCRTPISADDFFMSARKVGSPPRIDETALYFNIVRLGARHR